MSKAQIEAKENNNDLKNKLFKLIEVQKKPNTVLEYNIGDEKIAIEVKGTLSFAEKAAMSREIFDMVFMDESMGIDSYQPALLGFARRYAVLTYYTPLKCDMNTDELWTVLNSTRIVEDICEYVGDEIKETFSEADKTINARKDYIISTSNFKDIVEQATKFLDKMQNKFSKLDLKKLVNAFGNMPNLKESDIMKEILKNVKGKQDLDTLDNKDI